MKVLLVTNYKQGRGGISGQVELLHKHLNEDGVETAIFDTKGSAFKRFLIFNRLVKIAKNYDVIHANGCSGAGMIPIIFSVIAGRINKKRVVVTYHGGGADNFFAKHTRLVKKYLTKTDANIVLSGFLAKVFDKYSIPYTIIPNIVELDANAYRERETVNPNYVSIRTLSSLYNIECIIRAFDIVKTKLPEAKLTIVGDGPSRAELEKMVADMRIKDVTFTGRVPNSDIYKYLDGSDIMLSAPKIDNMPVSLLEAFNAGLLVISSNVGGVPYMVEDGVNGLLFESNNHQMLAEKMAEAVENGEKSKEMIWKAKSCVCDYTWGNIKDRLLEIYNNGSV